MRPQNHAHQYNRAHQPSDEFANSQRSFDARKTHERIRQRRPTSPTTVTHVLLLFHQAIARAAARATNDLRRDDLHIDRVVLHVIPSKRICAQTEAGTGEHKATLVLRDLRVKTDVARPASYEPILTLPPERRSPTRHEQGTPSFRHRNRAALAFAEKRHFCPISQFFHAASWLLRKGKSGSNRGSCRGELRTKNQTKK
jgi:hypothetical protein